MTRKVITGYHVIANPVVSDLNRNVQDAIKEGSQPFGNPFYSGACFCQAIVDYEYIGDLPDDFVNSIDAILNETGHCDCSMRESCEWCSPDGAYGRLRKKIREAVHGPDKPLTLADFERSIEIKM